MTGSLSGCAFCERGAAGDLVAASESGVAFRDKYPVSQGHTLVVPRAHVCSLFDLEADAVADIWRLVGEVRSILDAALAPDGFNVGLNDGTAAGQTVPHAHVHVIPRFNGDRDDPRGGVRWVLPDKAAYWPSDESRNTR